MNFTTILKKPDFVVLETEETTPDTHAVCKVESAVVKQDDMTLSFTKQDNILTVYLQAEETPVKHVRLRWNIPMPKGARYLGDAWERAYGDLEWRGLNAARFMPWYFLATLGDETIGYGVKVRPSALCFWQCDEKGITLFLDVRNGGSGVVLKGRSLQLCEIVCHQTEGKSPFVVAQEFCHIMCTDPILPKEPVYGSNNWYYAYGMSSEQEIVSDTDYVCQMTGNRVATRPFMVVDDGWQFAHDDTTCNGGPWHTGNEKFPDMPTLPQKIKDKNCKPGIWIRPLLTTDESLPLAWRFAKNHEVLDPSVPEVLAYVKETVSRIVDWGFQLLKHDFSTFDIFDRWGFEMNPYMTSDGWHFADRSKTSAEIVKDFYTAILEATDGKCYVLGCNCIGHLGAGLMHLQRVGDDTSGKHWERTRNIGINTLAFRLPQHKAFFDIDADCVGVMGTIPWEYNKQWTDLVARSGTSLFVSAKPGLMTQTELVDMKLAFEANAKQQDVAIPLDWMDTNCPSHWLINGEEVCFDWYEEQGLFGFGFDIK